MSQENMEILRAATDAVNRGDWDGYASFLHPEVEWETSGIYFEAGTYRGREEVLNYVLGGRDDFDSYTVEIEELVAADDETVVGDVRVRGIGRRSRVPVDVAFTVVARFREGLMYRLRNF